MEQEDVKKILDIHDQKSIAISTELSKIYERINSENDKIEQNFIGAVKEVSVKMNSLLEKIVEIKVNQAVIGETVQNLKDCSVNNVTMLSTLRDTMGELDLRIFNLEIDKKYVIGIATVVSGLVTIIGGVLFRGFHEAIP